MKELTAEEMEGLPEHTVVFDRDNDNLFRTQTGWRYSPIYDDGSYGEVGSKAAVRIWGPMTLAWKGDDWKEHVILNKAKDVVENLTEIWNEADITTQDLMIEMLHTWYLERRA